MTKTTYIATAPDGTELTRKTDRAYTHAVLLEGKEGWGIAGFCGRLDLAHKKQTEHPGSIVVEAEVLGATSTDTHEPKAAEPIEDEAVNAPDDANETTDELPSEPKFTVGAMVHELLMDVEMTYLEIVELVRERFPTAKTSARSVASTAAVLRRKGVDVPTRRKAAGA